jgi:HlyD family secretion protein
VLQKTDSTLVVSESVVEYSGDSAFVYVQSGPQVFTRTPIKVGLSDGIIVEVKEGITKDSELRGREIIITE